MIGIVSNAAMMVDPAPRTQTGDVDGKPAAHRLNVQRHQAAGVSGVVDISDAH